MQETNGTLERILERLEQRDEHMLQMIRELAGMNKQVSLMVDRQNDRLARLEESRT